MSSPETLLADGRAEAESLMADTCTIRAASTTGTWDENTGTYPEVPGSVLYQGKCKRQFERARQETIVAAGDHNAVIRITSLHIPVSAPRIEAGAVVVMTGCPNDPASVGSKFRVQGPGMKTWATAQRLNVLEVVG
jgi:hypothetical protein